MARLKTGFGIALIAIVFVSMAVVGYMALSGVGDLALPKSTALFLEYLPAFLFLLGAGIVLDIKYRGA